MILDLPFPLKGIDTNGPYESQTPGTTLDAMNVRGYDPIGGSDRGGQRSGHAKYMATVLNGFPIQDINHVSTPLGVPVPNPGDMVAPLSSGGSFEIFSSGAIATGTAGTAGNIMNAACWDASGNAYVGSITAAGNLIVHKVDRAGTVIWGAILLASSVGSTPAGIFGICWDNGSFIYVLGTGASLSPVLRIWKLAVSTGAIVGGTHLTSEASAAGLRDQTSTQPSLNVLAYASGFLMYPSAAHTVTLYNINTAAKITIDLGATNFGTCFTDITSDGGSFFYISGYTSGGPVSGLAKIATTGVTAFNVPNGTIVYSICYNAVLQQLGALNTTTFQTLSLLTGGQIAPITVGGSTWAVIRNSGIGGFNLYARASSSNFVQYDTGLNVSIATSTLVANNINAGVGVEQQTQPPSISLANLRIIGIAAGQVCRITPAGPVIITNGQVYSNGVPVIFTTALFGDLYGSDGLQMAYYQSSTDSMKAMVATAGFLPADSAGNRPRNCCTWRSRLVWWALPLDAQNWFMSAVGRPFDYDDNPSPGLATQAVAGNNSTAGMAPDVINCCIPYNDELLIMGLDHDIFMMTGDPAAGGRIDLVANGIGMAYGQPWCRDGQGVLYFMSSYGSIYKFAPGALPERISDDIAPLLTRVIDFSNTIIRMAWDEVQMGFMVYISPIAGGVTYNYFWDARNGGWWRDAFATAGHQPFAVHSLQGFTPGDRVILLGCQDGYIRFMDPTALDDDGTSIASYVFLGPLKGKGGQPALITDLQCTLGSASGPVNYTVYAGNSAQHAKSTPSPFTGTFLANRNRSQPVRCFGHAMYLKLSNPAGSHTSWATEYVRANVQPIQGRERIFVS